MSDVPLDLAADARARRLARERFDAPVLLEAGAGTGKTRALVERLLAWTLDAGWSDAAARLAARAAGARAAPDARAVAGETLDGVVAITFTDAAAAEMASRLATALAAVARGETPDEEIAGAERLGAATLRERAAALAEQLGRARIQTIHAFCRALLAQHPFEARLHPAFEIDSDQEQLERVASETLSARLSAALAAADADWIGLLGDGKTPEEILDAVVEAVARGVAAEELEADPFPPAGVAALRDSAALRLEPLARALAAVVGRLGDRAVVDDVEPMLRAVVDALAREPFDLAATSARVDELLAARRKTLREWADGKATKKIDERLEANSPPFAATVSRALESLEALAELDPERMAQARRVVAPLVREVRERLRRGGFVLFEELLSRAARLLAERGDVRASVRRGIRQLLVDEFQDTDRRQCEIVARLALDDGTGEAPGLFLVGDPKQSIYGWRNADLAAYEAFLDRARAHGAVEGRLAMNFRSLPAILDEVERLLAPALRAEPGLQPAFESLRSSPKREARGRERAHLPAVEHWVSIGAAKGAKTPAGRATRIEARAIAADLLAQRRAEPGWRWSQAALLARTGSDLEVYLDALREAGIAFAVEKDRSYWRRREIVDAAALVRATVDPGDHLALVTLLRAPFVGVPDAALAPLWRAGLPARVDALVAPEPAKLADLRDLLRAAAREIPAGVPGLERVADWEASAFAALEALAELRAEFGREPADRFVERLRARFALEATAAARYLGRFGVANLERFFRELETFLESAGDDPAALVRFLRRAVAEQRDAQEARPAEPDDDAVRVMTIHGAKGLQFGHVYLLQVHKGRGANERQRPLLAERAPDGALAYRLFGCRSLAWSAAAKRRADVAEREEARLLYVALTRAEDRLVVAGQRFTTHTKGSFLPYLQARLAGTPAETLRAGATDFEPQLDTHGVLWRAPGLERKPDLSPAAREDGAAFAADDPQTLARDLDLLTARRAAAAARAARPRLARASELAPFEPESLDDPEASAGRPSTRAARVVARARGVALHRALELAALAPADEVGWEAAARAAFLATAPAAGAEDFEELGAALGRLRASRLWNDLRGLADGDAVLARELPLLAAPAPADDSPPAPTDGYVGTLDLLYRDPATAELVVADFKSDAVDEEPAVDALVARYRPQLALYARAVQAALALPSPPRLELWLLAIDRVVRLSAAEAGGESG